MSILRRYTPRTLSLAALLALIATPVVGAQPDYDEDEQYDEAADEPEAAPPPAPPPPPAPAPAPDPEPLPTVSRGEVDLTDEEFEAAIETDGEVIEITGSFIRRRALTTAAPLAILDRTDLDATGLMSVGSVLQQIPSQSNAINVQFNNGGDGSTRVNLRGLGASRTLVLVNGRRHVPGGLGANSSVDLNAIPLAVIERIEVLKDGASAIYGSDAIGGVVNIITRTDLDGTEGTVYAGTSQHGGGTVYDVSLVSGTTSKRGNVVFSAGFHTQGSVMTSQRSYSETDKFYLWDEDGTVLTDGSSATPEGMIVDYGEDVGNATWDALVADNPSGAYHNDPTQGWRDANFGGVVGDGGDLYNYQPFNYLVTPQRRYNMYSSGNYELHDRVTAFFEASYVNRQSDQLLAPEPLFTIVEGIVVSADNHYNPFGRDFIDIRRRFVEAGNRRFIQNVDTARMVVGLQGDLPEAGTLKNWRWSLAWNWGQTKATDENQGRLIRSRVIEALGPSYRDGDGVLRCGTAAAPGDPACVPLNLFGGAGSIGPAQLNYITYTGIGQGFNKQKSGIFNLSGRLLDIPGGGDVSMAIGAEYRHELGGFQPDPYTAGGDTTGNKQEPTKGDFDVREAFAELSVVPVVGEPFAKWIELNAAVRGFNYSTFGNGVTWKTGALWQMPAGVSVRGTYSTAFRAPSIGALYSGTADSFPGVRDPCDTSMDRELSPTVEANCAADGLDGHEDARSQHRSLVGGNPELDPETAKILTAGVVYEPEFVPGMSVTADYFNVAVDNAITSLGAGVILNNCYGQTDRSDCDKVTRDANGVITLINDRNTNIGGAETAGVDLALRYEHRTPAGAFRHSLEGTWLHKYNVITATRTIEGKGVYDVGVYPSWKANFSTLWGYEDFGAGANVRFINGFKECEDDDCRDLDDPERDPFSVRNVSANVTADVFLSYTLDSTQHGMGKSRLTIGVNNVLDQDPAVIYNGFLATSDAATYDFLGRYFYLRFVQQM